MNSVSSTTSPWWFDTPEFRCIRRLDEVLTLSPEEFERYVGYLFLRSGYVVDHTQQSGDGGIDLYLYRAGELSVVQCKQRSDTGVTVPPLYVQALYGAMQAKKASAAYLVTTGTFSQETRETASREMPNLHLVDGGTLQRWIDKTVSELQGSTSPDYAPPPLPVQTQSGSITAVPEGEHTGPSPTAYRFAALVLVIYTFLDFIGVVREGAVVPSGFPVRLIVILSLIRGLLRSEDSARKWTLFLSTLSAGVFTAMYFYTEEDTLIATVLSVGEWIFVAAFFILLTGRTRVWRLVLSSFIFVAIFGLATIALVVGDFTEPSTTDKFIHKVTGLTTPQPTSEPEPVQVPRPTTVAEPPRSSLPTTAPESVWQEFSSEEGAFSVSMPGVPVEHEETTYQDGAKIVAHSFLLEREFDAYSVVYIDFPVYTPEVDGLQTLEYARDEIAENFGGKVRSERSISLSGYSGKRVTIDVPDPDRQMQLATVAEADIYWVVHRLYVVMAITPDQADSDDIWRFLNSFRFFSQ